MSIQTITVSVHIGPAHHVVDLVGDTSDGLFALQVGRSVAQTIIEHDEKMRRAMQ